MSKYLTAALLSFLLTGCVGSRGEQLGKPEEYVRDVPPIDGKFMPIPLKVAVYVSPEVARAITYSARAEPIVNYGSLGAAVVEVVSEEFPKAFADVVLVSDFPSPIVQLDDIDAVVVFETGIGSIHGGMTQYVDTLLNVGIYTPQGERRAGYRVVTTQEVKASSEVNIYRLMELGMALTRQANKAAVRMALHRFPRDAIQAGQRGTLADAATLSQRRRDLHAGFAASQPRVPGPSITAQQNAERIAQQQQVSAALSQLSASTSAQRAAMQPSNRQLQSMNNLQQGMAKFNIDYVAAATDPSGRSISMGEFFVQEFIGGVTERAQRKKIAQEFARTSSSSGLGSPQVCSDMKQAADVCRVNQGKLGGGDIGPAGYFGGCAQAFETAVRLRCR